jgi:hypothetical protein
VSRPRAQVVAADGVRIKSVKLHFLRSSSASLKSEIPSTPRITRSPSMAKCVARIFSAASAIFGERCVQSAPLRNSRTRSFCQMGVSRCFATRYADRSSNDGHDASENEPAAEPPANMRTWVKLVDALVPVSTSSLTATSLLRLTPSGVAS